MASEHISSHPVVRHSLPPRPECAAYWAPDRERVKWTETG